MPSFLRLMLLILAVAPGSALASVTRGTIKGQVVDVDNLPIPGVSISISSPNMMGEKQAQTDADGRYLFAELPPGVYELTATRQGFTSQKRTKIPVNAGQNAIINIEMVRSSGADDTMIVEETRPVIDTESGDRGSVLTKEFLQRIPAGRDYQSATQMAAGVTGGGNPNVGGAASNENTYMLDGVNITDPVTGTFSMNFNYDSIEQIQVLISPYDPEYGQNLGGTINIISESGGNTVEFEQSAYYSNGEWGPKLDATIAADGSQLAPTDFDSTYRSYFLSSEVSGPIVRDKAWFIVSYQLARTLISNVGIDLPRDYEGHYVFSKISWQPTTAHNFALTFQSDPTTIDNTDQSTLTIRPEAQGRQSQGGYMFIGQWNWFISPELFTETKATYQKSFIERGQVPCTHNEDIGYNPCASDELENNIDFKTAPRIGLYGAYDDDNYIIYDFDDRYRTVLSTKVSLLQVEALGTHDLKFGAETDLLWWDKIFGIPGNIYYVDLYEQAYNPDSQQNYYWIEYSNPLQYSTYSNTLGFFAQDVYKPISNLTIRYGSRYDRAIFRNDVGEKIIDAGAFGPRLSIIWDPWANAKTAIKASVGRFNNPGNFGIASYLSEGDLGYKLILGEYFGIFTSEAANDYEYAPIVNTNTVFENTTVPRSNEFLVGVEREIIKDMAAKVYFEGAFTRNLHAFDETNLVWDGTGYNIIGSGDSSLLAMYRMRTPIIAQRNYYRTDFTLEKVWSDRWEVQANYSYTVSRGSVQGTPSDFLSVPQQVDYFINGYLGTDIRHDVAAGFAWDIPNDPWTTSLGGIFFLESGYPITRTYSNGNLYGDSGRTYILKEQLGSYARTKAWWELSLRVEQEIPVRKGALSGIVEVQNITNQRVGYLAYVSGDNRWIVYGRQSPIRLSVGGRYAF